MGSTCLMSKSHLSYKGSLSNLKKHLLRKHPTVELPSNVLNRRPRQQITDNQHQCKTNNVIDETTPVIVVEANTGINPDLPSTSTAGQAPAPATPVSQPKKRQTSLASFIPKKVTSSDTNKIDLAVMKFERDFQPLTVVEDKGFKNLMNTCVPLYSLPSRKYFSNSLLPAIYEQKVNEFKEEIKCQAINVCMTADSWTSPTSDSYNGMTAQYINEHFEMKTAFLQCAVFNVSHTAQNLARDIKRVAQEWELTNKISMITTDNAANIVGAVNILQYKNFRCYAHKINLIVQDGLAKEEVVANTLKKVKSIVTFFKRSNAATQKLVKFQENEGVPQPKRLLQDVVARWNSTYIMLERLVLLENAVKHSLALSDTELTGLSTEEWEICKELCKIL